MRWRSAWSVFRSASWRPSWRPRWSLPRRDSLAGRLFASAGVLTFLILLVAGFVLSALHRNYAERAFDDRLAIYMKALVADLAVSSDSGDRGTLGDLGEPRFRTPLSGWYWQVTKLAPDNSTPAEVRASPSLFAGRLPHGDVGGGKPFSGAREVVATGADDRTLRMVESYIDVGEDGRYLVAVAGDPAEINDEVARFNWALVITFAVLELVLLVSATVQVGFGLRPLAELSRALGSIRRGEAERIDGQFPEEIAPLAGELNQLVTANREIVERARTQVGNLAHALKTPLSVLVNEAAGARGPLAGKVREQTTLMREQVQYYLDRARAATRAVAIGATAEVQPTVERLIRAFTRIYGPNGIGFEVDVAPGLWFMGERQDFEDILGNLTDNAGKWARSRVRVTVRPAGAGAGQRSMLECVIEDDGPGLPAKDREDVIRRGRRLDETKPGSGLGLSIVSDLVSLYGGVLRLDQAPVGGLIVSVTLPAVERLPRAAE